MNNRSIYWFAGGTLVLLILISSVLFYSLFLSPETEPEPSLGGSPFEGGPIINFPQGGGPTTGVEPAPETMTFPVKSVSGTLLVRDFMSDDGVWTSADGTYVVIEGTESATGTTDGVPYEIVYFPEDKGLLVSILAEPIGEVRRDATYALLTKLGIDLPELCTLVAQVTVPRGINDFYLGMNLGFPGCPGATEFPGDPVF